MEDVCDKDVSVCYASYLKQGPKFLLLNHHTLCILASYNTVHIYISQPCTKEKVKAILEVI